MNTVYVDKKADDNVRRELLYGGQVLAYSPRPSTVALCEFARKMLEEAFAPLDPLTAQFHMSVEEYVAIVAPLKPKFIHAPETKLLQRAILLEYGCDPETTYVDVPRLRMVTHDGYLTSGVGYAHHAHRDTWYSAPMCQLNWWLPIYPIESASSMAFHPRYWDKPVANDSADFNYYEWNSKGRREAAQHVTKDTRKQPKPQESLELEPQVRIVTEAGGNVLFSAAQLHSTVPNTSGVARYSIDFRTVNIEDVANDRGAPNIDSYPKGTSLRDFVRCSDFAPMPEDLARRFDPEMALAGELVFKPMEAAR